MTESTLDVRTTAQGVTTLTLSRPDKHNALDQPLIAALHQALATLADSDDTRVIVLTGAGKSFCAGGDLNWMKAQFDATREQRIEQAMQLADLLYALNTIAKPVVARVNGNAFGGGVGLLCTCDHVIADASARFGLTETRLGLIPATISPFVNARIGESRCRSRYLSAELFDADEAWHIGLIDERAESGQLDAKVQTMVDSLLARSPEAQGRAKRLARSQGLPIDAALLRRCAEALADSWESAQAIEGVSAFLEKRAPDWGRRTVRLEA